MPLKYTTISEDSFNSTLSRYSSTAPDKLQELDTLRYDTIPATVAKRREDGDVYLAKDEVEKLVEWKLKHGTFRPKLLQLVQSNPDSLIEETTRKAIKTRPTNLEAAIKILAGLKGIGPATASLLLSVAFPRSVPFFSDELFRWVMWEEKGIPNGWKRIIKYNNKEYEELVGRVKGLIQRLGVGAVDAEKVAWVLGKEGVDVGEGEAERSGVEKADQNVYAKEVKGAGKKVETKVKKGAKRKAVEEKPAAEVVRRSSRRKMDT